MVRKTVFDEDAKNRYLNWYPSLISRNPKRVIAVIIVFSIVMGYFALGMEMDTTEKAFTPDIPKERHLSHIRETFGRADETVQVAFVSKDGDIFTVDSLEDMLAFEGALLADPVVNRTLSRTTDVPSGITTLASIIMTANRTLELEEFIIKEAMATESSLRSMENQTVMYRLLNTTLSLNSALILHDDSSVAEGAKVFLESMSHVAAEPSLWVVTAEHQGEFIELMGILSSDMDHGEVADHLIHWLEEMQGRLDETPELEHFLGMVSGIEIILRSDTAGVHEKESARCMASAFLSIGEYIGGLDTKGLEPLNYEVPSLQLTLEERKEKVADMSDEDIKDMVLTLLQYDPSSLKENVSLALDRLESMDSKAESVIAYLDDIGHIIHAMERKLGPDTPRSLLKSDDAMNENRTILAHSKEIITESGSMFQGSLTLEGMIRRLKGTVVFTASKEFIPTLTREGLVRAESSMGIVFMNASLESDVRLRGQKRVIELGAEVCQHTETKVFANLVMMDEIDESADRSLKTLLPIAFIVVVLILLLVYRSIIETVLSLSSLGLAIVWTFGIAVILGYEFNPLIVAVPVLITGLVIDYGIHMVMRYREEKGGGNDHQKATYIAIITVGGALVLTTFTTVVGFLSNTLSNIQAMRQFGILAGIGISSSFILMTAFLPSALMLYDDRVKGERQSLRLPTDKIEKHGSDIIGRILSTSADASDRHPWFVLAVVLLVTISSIYGVINIDTTFDIQDFLPEGKPQSENIEYITANFEVRTGYAYILTVGDLETPEYLRALHETSRNIEVSEMVGGDKGDVLSPLTVIQDYGTAPPGSPNFNSSIVELYRASDITGDGIPDDNVTLIYDMLYEFQASRTAIKSVLYRTAEGEYIEGVIRVTEDTNRITRDLDNAAILEKELKGDVYPLEEAGYTTKITSSTMIAQETTSELTATQLRSLIFTILIVATALSFVFYHLHRSILLGLITTAPVALVTLWIVGTMYALGVTLNVMTVSITALTVGMGVDYSIHITHRFNEECTNSDLYGAMHETVNKTGAGLFGSAATTVAAFAVISTSEILPMAQFGLITAIAITYSFLAAVFVLPSALMLWAKYRH